MRLRHAPPVFSSVVFLFIVFLFITPLHAATQAGQNVGFQIEGQNTQQPFAGVAPVVIQGQAPSSQGQPTVMAQEPVVEGFADKVPLTIALQQVLPQGYGYTLGDGVDPGQLVSWRGGRPWQVVLQDMTGASGLVSSVNGRSVTVGYTGASPAIISGVPIPPKDDVMAPAPVPQPVLAPQPVPQPPQQDVVAPVYQSPTYQPYDQQQAQVVYQQPVAQYAPPAPVMDQAAPQLQQPVAMPMVQPASPQPMPQPQPPSQQAAAGPQPLQIENPMIYVPQVWEARPGQSLRAVLQEWCGRVGAELNWSAEYDYPVMASMNMSGTFEEAVRVLLSGFDNAKPTPRGRLHLNPAAGQSILIVEASGNNYGE